MRYRRQKQQYFFAALLGTIAVVNVLFFLILHRPARSEYFRLEESIGRLRTEVRMRERLVEQMDKTSSQLARFDQDRRELFHERFVPRVPGYAAILPKLEDMAQRSGVRTSRKDYGTDEIPEYGLSDVSIKFPVQGSYGSIVNFIRELEKSDTLFLIDSIDVKTSEDSPQSGSSGTVALTLSLETFFYQ